MTTVQSPIPMIGAIQEFTVMCITSEGNYERKRQKAIGRIVEDTIEKITKRTHIVYDRVHHSYLGEM